MRLIHTADWHLGKHIEGHSRLEEQELFLEDFVDIVKERDADVVLIAGDIYDSSNPPAKAEQLFYDTLKKISEGGRRLTIVIAGNHDNPERLVSATPLAMEHGIIMVGTPKTVIPKGQYGSWKVCRSGEGYIRIERKSEQAVVLTVPFPSEKRLEEVLYSEMESEEIQLETYNERLRCLFDRLADQFEEETVNIIVSHLFVMDSLEEGSERSIQLGGSYLADPDIFPKLADYVALGHIHGPQKVKSPHIRYCGTPLKYSLSEEKQEKSITMVTLGEKGMEPLIETLPLHPMRDVRRVKGTLEEVLKKAEEEGSGDFVSVTLTDEEELYRPGERLQKAYEYLLEYRIENRRTQNFMEESEKDLKVEDPLSVFRTFYEEVQGVALDEKEEAFMSRILEKAREEI